MSASYRRKGVFRALYEVGLLQPELLTVQLQLGVAETGSFCST